VNVGQTTFSPGTFQGIIRSDSDNDESFGFITLTLTRLGTFSMRFNLGVNSIGHHSYGITGRFSDSGAFHYEGPPVADTRYAVARFIDLQMDSVGAPMTIHGNITDLTHSSTIELERVAAFSFASPAAEAGRYTFLIPIRATSGFPPAPVLSGRGQSIGHVVAVGWRLTEGHSPKAPLLPSWTLAGVCPHGPNTKGILSG